MSITHEPNPQPALTPESTPQQDSSLWWEKAAQAADPAPEAAQAPTQAPNPGPASEQITAPAPAAAPAPVTPETKPPVSTATTADTTTTQPRPAAPAGAPTSPASAPSPEQTQPKKHVSLRTKLIAGGAAAAVLVAGGFGVAELLSGGKKSPHATSQKGNPLPGGGIATSSGGALSEAPTSVSPSELPSAEATAPDGKTWSAERAAMRPIYSERENLVKPEYFQPKENVDSNINKENVIDTINALMHNRWYAVSTGEHDALLATFGKGQYDTAAGEWGAVKPAVDQALAEHQQDASNVAADPNFPLGSTVVTKINDIQPISTQNLTVTTEITSTMYKTDSKGQPVPYTVAERVTLDLDYKTITNWSDGDQRTMWVIGAWEVNQVLDSTSS